MFRYETFSTDPDRGSLTCGYSVDGRSFTERISLTPSSLWLTPRAQAAARLVFLLAGVSYYKTAAPPVIDLGQHAVTDAERGFLRKFYLDGLGEFAYRNDLDLSGLRIEGPSAPVAAAPVAPASAAPASATSTKTDISGNVAQAAGGAGGAEGASGGTGG
ncbi:MAG: hypothetical protein J2P26_02560, partial [Nocardiopsaceae bacterium]|nr:hypothetical protein [Nocardiopsaceae bacterium]